MQKAFEAIMGKGGNAGNQEVECGYFRNFFHVTYIYFQFGGGKI